ncbi:hypothetical protein BH10PLA2_BH10PLA2_21150 [soil metagenome]
MLVELVSMYDKGAIAADHLVSECLTRLDPSDPASVLESLPQDHLLRILQYSKRFLFQGP